MTGYRDLEDAPVVLHQAFPVNVTGPDGTAWRVARVVLTRGWLHVWTAPGEPVLSTRYADTDLAGVFAPPGRANTVTVPDGRVTWTAAGGCGCSHPLKGFRPFAPMRLGTR